MNNFYRRLISLLVPLTLWAVPGAKSASGQDMTVLSPVKSDSDAIAATVTKIIDGDTFVLSNGGTVRLLGLDTPETGEPFAQKAKIFAEIVLNGKQVRIETEKQAEDKYGRLLAYIFVNGKLYNELVLQKGLAGIYFFSKHHRYAKRLIAAQNAAREDKVGIWSLPAPASEPYYIVPGGSFRFHRPLCTAIKDINIRKAKRYKTRDAALDAGLSPCRECKP